MKKITMFVWNHFTNDARVMREALALSETDHDVNLIAIENKKDERAPAHQVINENFRVHRVPMYPKLLEIYQNHKRRTLLAIGVATIVVVPILYYISWVLAILYFLLLAGGYMIIRKRTLRKHLINLTRGTRMTIKGYFQHSDVYHSHDLNTLAQGIICAKFRFKKRKLIYDSHEVQTDRTGYNPNKVFKIENCLLKAVDVTIVENHTRAKRHEELYGYYPETLYNYSELYATETLEAVDLNKKLGLPPSEKILLYQGGLQAGRGLELLVDAMEEVEEGTLVFIGDGKLKPLLEKRTIEKKLEDRIKFHPKVHLTELPKYTKNAYLGFQVLQNTCYNHYSASSNKLFEYIMAHVPVVSNDFPEIKRVVRQAEVGLSLDTSHPSNIAEAVNRLLRDEALRDQLSSNCREAKEVYNWDNEKHKLFKIYAQF